MDSSIWSQLPDFLLDHILAYLPLAYLLTLRTVSHTWNSKVLSPSIASLRVRIFPPRPGFIRISGHNSRSGCLQLDYLDRHFHWRKVCLGVPPGSIEIEAAHAHLLCCSMTFSSQDGYVFKRFLMCNPVTASCRYLPSTLLTCYPIIVGMIVERRTGEYVILFGGNFRIAKGGRTAMRTAEVYRSITGKWSKVADMPAHVTPVLNSVACDGCIYWLAWSDDEEFGLLIFNAETDGWVWRKTSCDLDCNVPWGLMERHGSLYKVGQLSSTTPAAYIWKLEPNSMEWQTISEVPSDPERHCRSCVRYCVGHDGAFYADNTCGSGGLIFKFSEKEEVLPPFSSLLEDKNAAPEGGSKRSECTPKMVAPFGHLYVFEPCLGKT